MIFWRSRIETILNHLLQGQQQIMIDLTALQAAVTKETTVGTSAVALLKNLSAQIADLVAKSGDTVDPAALQAIADQLDKNADDIANAVIANTPAPVVA